MTPNQIDQAINHYINVLASLIQVQRTHNKTSSTVLLVEAWELSDPCNSLFISIQYLCNFIYILDDAIISLGKLIQKVNYYEYFNIFDLS